MWKLSPSTNFDLEDVWWRPEGSNDSILTAVRIKPGPVTEAEWEEALADRVTDLVLASENPQEALNWAVDYLNQENTLNLMYGKPNQAGQILVTHNLALIQVMSLNNPEFPQIAEANIEDPDQLDDLDLWVEVASAAI
jgi:hypothetical protein